ncbi:hypothetical protein [Burkholderia ubonensis]|uniref:hypothetical protein n=1 Tax=Burkholderia ubonensis TaxID=101571 RepID=UPI0011601385|nr:hypothetical protein [Burkholderia ubonensis]
MMIGRHERSTDQVNPCTASELSRCIRSATNASVKLHDSDAEKIFWYRKEFLQQELNHLHVAASERRGVADRDVDLATYLTARATVHRSVDSQQLQGLRKANDSVNETRARLIHGRGNVSTNLLESEEPYWRTKFGREQSESRSLAFGIAMAMRMGAGNCGEHGGVAAALHAGKLDKNETVQLVEGANGFDHGWSETQLADGDRLVIDAWTYGPAVMAEDSAFSQKLNQREVLRSWGQEDGKKFSQEVEKKFSHLVSDKELDYQWSVFKMRMQNMNVKLHENYCWAPTPVFGEMFLGDVRRLEDLNFVRGVLKKHRVDSNDLISSKLRMGLDIKAVGSARTLGANVRQALGATPKILSGWSQGEWSQESTASIGASLR